MQGADPNSTTEFDTTPLHDAAQEGYSNAITTLVNIGADPNVKAKNGATPLHHATFNGHTEAVTALLDAGADPSIKANNIFTTFDMIDEDSPIYGTDAYWRLKEATEK